MEKCEKSVKVAVRGCIIERGIQIINTHLMSIYGNEFWQA